MKHGPYAVIEGPDGVGKTVLAEHLARIYGFHYVHCGPPEKDARLNYLGLLREYEGPVVADRLHAGSWVYGMAFRGGPDMTDYEEWAFEGYLLARGAILVNCTVAPEVVERNLARGPDSEDARTYEDPAKRARLVELYEEFMRRTSLSIVHYSFTDGNIKRVAAGIDNILAADMDRRPKFEAGMLGNPIAPKLVLVGEQPNGRLQMIQRFKKQGAPMVLRGPRAVQRALRLMVGMYDRGGAFSSGGAGRYLFQTLRAAGLGLRDVCVINAIQWDGRTVSDLVREDPEWWKQFAGGRVVALGNIASEQLRRAGILHRKVPHPQYVRRFFYKRVLEYGKLIRGETPYMEEEWRHGRV